MVGFEGVRRVKPSGPSRGSSRRGGPGGLGERLEVGAGAEGLGVAAGEHQPRALVVGFEAAKALGQQARGLVVDGVAPLGPGDREDGRGARALVGDLRTRRMLWGRAKGLVRRGLTAAAAKATFVESFSGL